MAPATCFAPSTAAFLAGTPRLRMRYIFSITTMELSTSIPTPRASPEREIILSVTPEKYMSTRAATTLMGMEQAMTKVGLISRRNKNSTRIARIPPYSIFCRTELTTISI